MEIAKEALETKLLSKLDKKDEPFFTEGYGRSDFCSLHEK